MGGEGERRTGSSASGRRGVGGRGEFCTLLEWDVGKRESWGKSTFCNGSEMGTGNFSAFWRERWMLFGGYGIKCSPTLS